MVLVDFLIVTAKVSFGKWYQNLSCVTKSSVLLYPRCGKTVIFFILIWVRQKLNFWWQNSTFETTSQNLLLVNYFYKKLSYLHLSFVIIERFCPIVILHVHDCYLDQRWLSVRSALPLNTPYSGSPCSFLHSEPNPMLCSWAHLYTTMICLIMTCY